MYDHPIEHIIKEISVYDFPELGDYQSWMWLGDPKEGYNPDQYYKAVSCNSKVHGIYTTTIGYDTGTTFPITINGHTVKALLDTGAERSCMNLDTFKKLKLKNLNTSYIPTLKGATGHDMLAQGITTCDIHINDLMFSNSFIVCTRQNRPIILGRDFTIWNAISVGWTRQGTKMIWTDGEVIMECQGNFKGNTLALFRSIRIPPCCTAVVEVICARDMKGKFQVQFSPVILRDNPNVYCMSVCLWHDSHQWSHRVKSFITFA